MIAEIEARRSIRKYQDKIVAKEDILEIIQSGINAPSSKNRQPWQYVIVQGQAKAAMLDAFRAGIAREETGEALLPQSRQHLAGAKYTVKILEQAPVVIFVINSLGHNILDELSPEERIFEICNIQSVSAAIQNMLLAATHKGLGSLWVCDIYFAYQELSQWLNVEGELLAAVALGYPDELPPKRPRKMIDTMVEWRE